MTAGLFPRQAESRFDGLRPRSTVLLGMALCFLAAPCLAHAVQVPDDGPFIARSEAIVTRLSGGARLVERWFVYTLVDGDRLWIKMESSDEGANGLRVSYFAAADGDRWRLGRWLPGEGTALVEDPSTVAEVSGTGFDLKDLAAVIDRDRVPSVRPADGKPEVSALDEAGGKGSRGIRIRRADGTERVVTFLSEGQRGGRAYVRKFQVASPGIEGATVVEFRDFLKIPLRPGALGSLEEFRAYRFREEAPPVNAE